jgi:hypothetical protein
MGMSVRLGRGRLANIGIAAGLLCAGVFGSVVVSITTAGVGVAQTVQTRIDIEGNPGWGRYDSFYFASAA